MVIKHIDHSLAEARSLVYHQHIAAKLQGNPELIEKICDRLQAKIINPNSPAEQHWANNWLKELDQPLARLLEFIVERSERADQFRQSTPFAGLLSPAERWAIHRAVKQEWLRQQSDDAQSA